MSGGKKPMQRTLILAMVVFVASLSVVMSIQVYYAFSSTFYREYDERLENILENVKHNLNVDELAECIENEKTSWMYLKMQQTLNSAVDDFDLENLYVVIPKETVMVNVISATSAKDRESGKTDLPLLAESDAFTEQTLARYRAAWEMDKISFFEESRADGKFYTAVFPLRDSWGETVALLCADLSTETLHRTLLIQTISEIAVIVLIGLVFAVIAILWLRKNVIHPIRRLEKSTREYAQLNRNGRERAAFDPPDIHTGNEVESLSEAFVSMSEDMDHYIADILSAEKRARDAEKEAMNMTMVAYKDPLTHVQSKAAYERKRIEMGMEVEKKNGLEFAVVMVDLNNLKSVNDTYGHANGDAYIIGASQILCRIFDHSPVYRIGGDEFVAILQGEDYAAREKLFTALTESYRQTAGDEERKPWQRYSAACGMAEYDGMPGETLDSVAQRADARMYQNKQSIKANSEK